MEAPPISAGGHIVVVPYPSRGHINPMMHLSKLLVSKNTDILITFVVTEEWLNLIGPEPEPDNIRIESIPNIMRPEKGGSDDLVAFVEAVMTKMEAPFERLLDRLEPPTIVIIYDTFLFWIIAVGNRRQIPVASFWTTSTSMLWMQYHYLFEQKEHLHENLSENGDKLIEYIPGISSMRRSDFFLLDGSWHSQQILQWVLKAQKWMNRAQYLLIPSIYELEPQVIDALKAKFSFPIYTIGPTIPYFSLEVNNPTNPNFTGHRYLDWLDHQPCGSVLYISHGSYLSISSAQSDEIAAGLRLSGVPFLWIARGEASRVKEICGTKGMVLAWCDQLRVLSHPSIGGFWTHCGWNSIMEGVFSGIPFLTLPIAMDQLLNSKIIVEDWKVAWRVKKDDYLDTLVTKEEISGILRKFMDLDSDLGRDMRKRAKELGKICQLAIANGGSSEINIKAFVNDIISLLPQA